MSTVTRILAALAKKPTLYCDLAALATDAGDLNASLRDLLYTGRIVSVGPLYSLTGAA